jgi:hypothetical protein
MADIFAGLAPRLEDDQSHAPFAVETARQRSTFFKVIKTLLMITSDFQQGFAVSEKHAKPFIHGGSNRQLNSRQSIHLDGDFLGEFLQFFQCHWSDFSITAISNIPKEVEFLYGYSAAR